MYLQTPMNQKEIAAKVEVTPKTLGKWINTEGWEQLRASFVTTKQQELARIYQQINALNDAIQSREDGKRYAQPREADTLSKLASSARSLEIDTSVADVIDVFIDFSRWLQETDYEKAKEFNDYQDTFIKHKLGRY